MLILKKGPKPPLRPTSASLLAPDTAQEFGERVRIARLGLKPVRK